MGKIKTEPIVLMVLVFFTDPVSLETLAEICEQIKLENVAVITKLYTIGKSISFAPQWY